MRLINSYYVNIAMESIATIFLLFLLAVIRRQQKQLNTRKYLGYLVMVEAALLLCQIGEWFINMQKDITFANHPFLFVSDKILFELDLTFMYSIYLFGYIYITKHIEFLRSLKNDNRKFPRKVVVFFAAWLVVLVALHITSIWTNLFFHISPTGKISLHYNIYWVIYLMGWLVTLNTTIAIIKNRKILGTHDSLIFLSYLYIPSLLLIVDIFYYTCLSYIALAIIIFLVFIRIDIGQVDYLNKIKLSGIKKEAELRDIKIQLVVSQVQPHFIYNTLNAIHYLVGKNPEYAQKIIKDFSKYLRMNMDSLNGTGTIEFSLELEHIKTYLEIEQLRFDDLTVEYDIEVTDFFLPALSIQPLVENAVKHGICQHDDGGTVYISTRETENFYIITIEDNGTGFDVNQHFNDGKSHIGIENTRKRLKEMCNADFKIESSIDVGTKVTIKIPKAGFKDEYISS